MNYIYFEKLETNDTEIIIMLKFTEKPFLRL